MDRKQRKILVADDQQVSQKLLSMILEKLGYDSILASDGGEVLEKAPNHDLALVFMDIQMPKMNGYEAAKELRNRGFTAPIIAVTATILENERETYLNAGINDLLIKPFKRPDIEMILEKWINAKDTADVSITGRHTKHSVFDAAEMLDTFMNNKAAAMPLLSRFIKRTRDQLEELPELERNANWEAARREAHMIKGAALTMSGVELGKAAAHLEEAYNSIEKDDIETARLGVCKAFDDFRKEAENFLASEET
ncbi:MAG: response regulator [Treponema sp.]|jgi:CheY-like chemotaxis protein/HPt (histidine-containing phosphotransfer) domain-containing protein|nr:response regulator [Treponema sp.]